MSYAKRPYTAAIARARENGATYEDLARRSGRARSQKWFWDLLNSDDPWTVLPPGRDKLAGMCTLLGVSRQTLKAWIAAEWYDTKDGEYSLDTIDLAATIASLNNENTNLLKALAQSMWRTQLRESLCDIEVKIGLLRQSGNSA